MANKIANIQLILIISTSSMIKKLSLATFGAVTTIGILASVSNAAVLGKYTFDPSPGNTNPSLVATGLTFSNFSAGSGITANGGNAYDNGNPGLAYNFEGWTTNNSINTNDYYAFTITPQAGYTVTLNDITLDDRRSSNGPTTREIRSSIDNYNSTISGSLVTNLPDSTFVTRTTTLGNQFANLAAPVTFRIYGYNAGTSGGTLRVDNVTANGTAIPEPLTIIGSATALIFGGTLKRKFNLKKKLTACKAS